MSNISVTNFNTGVIAPQADARSDIEKYPGACRRLDNMIPDIYGNATRRPGTQRVISGTGGTGNKSGCYFITPDSDQTKTHIYTIEQLQAMNDDLDGNYELMNDIDLDGVDWTPIGNVTNKFTGTFDGRYYEISNLSLLKNGDAANVDLGLFGYMSGGEVKQVRLKDFEISGYDSMGGLCGHFTSNTNFTDCHIDGITITGARLLSGYYRLTHSAGLIGEPEGTVSSTLIYKCSAINVKLRGEDCNSSGGLVGLASDCTDCYSQGQFIAWNWATDTESSFAANKSNNIGGLSGVGSNSDYANCYSSFLMPPLSAVLSNDVGGFTGVAIGGTFSDCFWDTDFSEMALGAGDQSGADGLTGKTTVQMYAEATYTNWDFEETWRITEGKGYPSHKWQRKAELCVWIYD